MKGKTRLQATKACKIKAISYELEDKLKISKVKQCNLKTDIWYSYRQPYRKEFSKSARLQASLKLIPAKEF